MIVSRKAMQWISHNNMNISELQKIETLMKQHDHEKNMAAKGAAMVYRMGTRVMKKMASKGQILSSCN